MPKVTKILNCSQALSKRRIRICFILLWVCCSLSLISAQEINSPFTRPLTAKTPPPVNAGVAPLSDPFRRRNPVIQRSLILSPARAALAAKPLLAATNSAISFTAYRPATNIRAPYSALDNHQSLVQAAALRNNLDPRLLFAMIEQESRGRTRAVSSKGAMGLMQLMPATAARFGAQDAFDPAQNIEAGARYMRFLLNLFRGDVRLALAGYNAGEGAVIKFGWRIPPYAETINYVEVITRNYWGAAQFERRGQATVAANKDVPSVTVNQNSVRSLSPSPRATPTVTFAAAPPPSSPDSAAGATGSLYFWP